MVGETFSFARGPFPLESYTDGAPSPRSPSQNRNAIERRSPFFFGDPSLMRGIQPKTFGQNGILFSVRSIETGEFCGG